MNDSYEYQIYIGYNDSQLNEEIVDKKELEDMVLQFFEKKQIDFSLFNCKGGYLYDEGTFIFENSLCINFVGDSELDVFKLAKNLSMFMNQECSLITRNRLNAKFV